MTIIVSALPDDLGSLGFAHGIFFPLTPCCQATGKGSVGSFSGVVCRSCYEDIDAMYGDCAVHGNVEALFSMLSGMGIDRDAARRVTDDAYDHPEVKSFELWLE